MMFGSRANFHPTLQAWNQLPANVHHTATCSTFKKWALPLKHFYLRICILYGMLGFTMSSLYHPGQFLTVTCCHKGLL